MAVWDDENEDDPDGGSTLPWATRRSGQPPPAAVPDPARLLLPLARAEDLVSRLDARAGGGAASEVLRQGLPAHPHDLALRATSLTGSWSAASDLHPLERAMPTT